MCGNYLPRGCSTLPYLATAMGEYLMLFSPACPYISSLLCTLPPSGVCLEAWPKGKPASVDVVRPC